MNQAIKTFGGNPKDFKKWIKSVEKYALLTGANQDASKKRIAFQSCDGSVSDFVQRYMDDNPAKTWKELRTELTSRFAEISDPQDAFMLLRSVKQKHSEGVQIYAERQLNLAEEAYEGLGQGGEDNPAIQRQLIVFFTDGLSHEYMQKKLMRENPTSLKEAVASATRKQNISARFELSLGKPSSRGHDFNSRGHDSNSRRREEPMDVDHARQRRNCFSCGKPGHWARDCRSKRVNAVNEREQEVRVCWLCNQPGHFKRHCPNRTPRKQKQGN